MSQSSKTIPKNPLLAPAADFYRLRREGIGFIEQMASQLWTDYNTHDPGITMLEALCYAITDLAYRIEWDIKDILAPATPSTDPLQPYPKQAFFTARKILTVNPASPDDFRRLLIDREKVRNGWVFCKECMCESSYYAWCENHELRLSCQKPADDALDAKPVTPKGLYDVVLELEADPLLGDLNDHKIEYKEFFHDDEGAHEILLEVRFPDLANSNFDLKAISTIQLTRLGKTKNSDDNVFTIKADEFQTEDENQYSYIRRNWRNVFYLDLKVDCHTIPASSFTISNIALRIFVNSAQVFSSWLKSFNGIPELRKKFQERYAVFFLERFYHKVTASKAAVESAKSSLHAHRNLDEDWCSISIVGIEDVAVCADVEVKPDVDIEWVQARIWFEIEQYLNPPIRFHTLQELLDAGEAVEEIFNGPELDSGFIKPGDLEASSLKSVLRVSDIINRLMEIEGVISINQLLLTRYDAEGNAVKGMADPDGINGAFDPDKTSASWQLYLSKQHQPRLYRNLSRFLFYKNGLPFQPRMDEALDTLNQLYGEAGRPKNKNLDYDLSIPKGTFRNPQDYYPVQYSLPQVYGTGTSGLPSHVSSLRRGQAKQMKAYLLVFEQILGNALAQLCHTADLFSLDSAIKRTYFVKAFSEKLIQGFDEIKNDHYKTGVLEEITETLPEFLQRRNQFLDHILARFGEQFSEYALLLSKVNGKKIALERLIDDKISFLTVYPLISHDRAKAFNYSQPVPFNNVESESEKQYNESGIKKRISLLLGYPDLAFFVKKIRSINDQADTVVFILKDSIGTVWLKGKITVSTLFSGKGNIKAFRDLLVRMNQSMNYRIVRKQKSGLFQLKLTEKKTMLQAEHPLLFSKKSEAEQCMEELMAWSANERLMVVEHLLLRPKFPGDALYPACSEGNCSTVTCSYEDPYSFRLTFVMPGWTKLYNENLEMRRFAERTIRQETPSHLLGKICWVSNDGEFENFEEAWLLWLEANAEIDWTEERLHERIEALLRANLTTVTREANVCDCAKDILARYGQTFYQWMQEKIKAGTACDIAENEFIADTISICNNLISDKAANKRAATDITNFLNDRYNSYSKSSCRLRILVNLLGNLSNTYPVATLHDCDDGSDQNPVRLDNTALGELHLY